MKTATTVILIYVVIIGALEDFVKRKFGAYQEINFESKRILNKDGEMGAIIPCMVLAVDFDERLLKIMSYPDGDYEAKEGFWVRCEHIHIPKPKLKVTKK